MYNISGYTWRITEVYRGLEEKYFLLALLILTQNKNVINFSRRISNEANAQLLVESPDDRCPSHFKGTRVKTKQAEQKATKQNKQ